MSWCAACLPPLSAYNPLDYDDEKAAAKEDNGEAVAGHEHSVRTDELLATVLGSF